MGCKIVNHNLFLLVSDDIPICSPIVTVRRMGWEFLRNELMA